MGRLSNGKRAFISADWQNLAAAHFPVDSAHLKPYLPKGFELDDFAGEHYLSMVCFNYAQTRLLNVRVPLHQTFEEINLRMYVKQQLPSGEWRKGVVFPRLFFPKRALSFVGRRIYKENYQTRPMKHSVQEAANALNVRYELKNGSWHSFSVHAGKDTQMPPEDSRCEFFNSHLWGHAKLNPKGSTEYKIEHPPWEIHNIIDYDLDMDFAKAFGSEFGFLNELKPSSVMLTKGSKVLVERVKISS